MTALRVHIFPWAKKAYLRFVWVWRGVAGSEHRVPFRVDLADLDVKGRGQSVLHGTFG